MAIGNINNAAGVGYTDMTGLGLSSDTQDSVKLDASISDSMSQEILDALAQFRAEGNFNPTSAEMEARLSTVADASRQLAINDKQHKIDTVQHLLDGFKSILSQQSLSVGGGSATNTTDWGWTETSVVAGDDATREQYFGKEIAQMGPWAVHGLLGDLVPGWNANLAAGVSGGNVASENSGFTNAQLSGIIGAITTRLNSLKTELNTLKTDNSFQASGNTAGGLTAHQWLARELGANPHDSYSLAQWGAIAEKLQTNAAKKRSELSLGNGGGIQQVNGQYFVNGQEMSLSQVNFCVRANQYQLIDQQIADQMEAIQRNNAKAKQAQSVLDAFKTYDNEKIGVDQSATQDVSSMMNSGGGSSGVIQRYLNTNYGVTDTSVPSYQDYANMMESGVCSSNYTTLFDLKNQLPNVSFTPTHGKTGSDLQAAWTANNAAVVGTAGGTSSVAYYLGLTVPAAFADVTAKLATLVPGWTPPPGNNGNDWSQYTLNSLVSAISTKMSQTNSDFSALKSAFGTYLQSNSTDNQVAQQRLDALNNSRQSILDGMSAFTQGQAQVTDRIGGNL